MGAQPPSHYYYRRLPQTNSPSIEVVFMKSQTTDRETMSGPKDQSLNAYKAWIRDIARRLTTTKSAIELTEAEWTAYWQDFWKEKYRS